MRHVVIDQKDSSLHVERGILIIQHDEWVRPHRIPLTQLDSVIIQTKINLQSTVLTQLCVHGVRLQIIAAQKQGDSCYLVGPWHNDAKRRLQQYALCYQPESKQRLAATLVRLRLRSQRLLLLDAALMRQDLASMLRYSAQQIKQLAQKIEPSQQISVIRGYEGAATAVYFKAYQALFAPALEFHERNRRPPKDPVNVLLSLSYTLLHGVFLKAVNAAGLDPQLGVLHDISFGRDSLVCDLMELKRASIEQWVWQLFASQTIRLEDFSFSDAVNQWPCSFAKAGRGRFYAEFAAIQDTLLKDAQKITWLLVKRLPTENNEPPRCIPF